MMNSITEYDSDSDWKSNSDQYIYKYQFYYNEYSYLRLLLFFFPNKCSMLKTIIKHPLEFKGANLHFAKCQFSTF